MEDQNVTGATQAPEKKTRAKKPANEVAEKIAPFIKWELEERKERRQVTRLLTGQWRGWSYSQQLDVEDDDRKLPEIIEDVVAVLTHPKRGGEPEEAQ